MLDGLAFREAVGAWDTPIHLYYWLMKTIQNDAILIFSDEFPPDGGGAGVVAKQLALDLRILRKDITLLVGASTNQRSADEKLIEVTRFTFIWPFIYLIHLIKLKISRFRSIVLNDYISAYIAGLFFSKKLLARSIIIVHGNDGEFFFAYNSLKHRVFQYRFFYKRALRYCKCIIASSRYARDEFLQYTSRIIDPGKVQYAYMGINSELMGSQTLTNKADLGLPPDAILLFTASRLVEDKGLLNMLDHFMEAANADSRLYWHIAGEGPLRARLEEKIRAYGLLGRVTLLGRLDRTKIANQYGLADVFWLLSKRKAETFGLVYIEAAYYGTPSIALRYAGVPEAISEGVSGFFLDEGENLSSLIGKCLALNRNACKNFARNFLSINFAMRILDEG
jgi:glycosyltransferase involved in cell wall biosynthesis